MLSFVLAVCAIVGYVFLCWVWYLAVMNLKAQRDQLIGCARWLAKLTLAIGLVLDFFLNVIVATLVFLDLPREATVTKRLSRYCGDCGWRSRLAFWICNRLLDPFDPEGKHC